MSSKFIMRYSHLFNLGNYENEKIEIEREFSSEIDSLEALRLVKAEVLGIQQKLIDQENKMRRYHQLQEAIASAGGKISQYDSELKQLEKELDITPMIQMK